MNSTHDSRIASTTTSQLEVLPRMEASVFNGTLTSTGETCSCSNSKNGGQTLIKLCNHNKVSSS
jgi:hypothetical protein